MPVESMSKELFAAIARGDLDGVADLLEKGADPNRLSSEWPYWSPLEEAINLVEDGGPTEMLELLLRKGARVNDWDERNGWTPLLMMVMSGVREGTRIL